MSADSISDEHRRKVGEGVSRAWRKRYGEGFRPKSPAGQLKWIARLLHTNDPMFSVQWLEESHRHICGELQTVVQKYHLGLGGEQTVDLVVEELERLRETYEPSGRAEHERR